MFPTRLYYRVKPLLPRQVRMAVRRQFALRKRERVKDVWPILPGSERPPQGWPSWPDGKQFAVVLTHDVEGPEGLAKCRQLMELEKKFGFRSCFNFIPEGSYRVPDDLRAELIAEGFEVGVHDLHHDGRLYRSREAFAKNAARINQYLKDWGAVGFRSGFMLRNLDWLHDLDIAYDASTFDTDPFEPQPDGAGTIFPFWVAAEKQSRKQKADEQSRKQKTESRNRDDESRMQKTESRNRNSDFSFQLSEFQPSARSPQPSNVSFQLSEFQLSARQGYVELPYTLPQDSTLFLLLRETSPDIWIQKLDWIAQHGGMVLLDTHPDYMAFDGAGAPGREYFVDSYTRVLQHLQFRYNGAFWSALPREIAAFCHATLPIKCVNGKEKMSQTLKSLAIL